MAKKSIDQQGATPTEMQADLTAGMEDRAFAAQTRQEEQMAGQFADLKQQVASLILAIETTKQQEVQNAAFQNTIGDLKADLQLTRALLTTPPATRNGTVEPAPHRESGKECGCECTAPGCCCFEIRLAKVRAAKPQFEIPDTGDIPVPVPLINALEVSFYLTVDGIGFLFPGIGSTMDLRANGLPGGPGPWVVIERVINRVCLPRGVTKTIDVLAEVREHDEGAERPLAFKDELGEGRGSITLDCCMAEIFPPMPIDVHLLHGGEGGGMVQFVFYARRVCC